MNHFIIKYSKGIIGICLFMLISYILSIDKKKINYKNIVIGIVFQIILVLLLLKFPLFLKFFSIINKGLHELGDSTSKAMNFIFGKLSDPNTDLGFILALHGFPILITISALSSILYYLKILPFFINIISKFFKKVFKISSQLGVAITTNLFVGQSETPILVKPYLKSYSDSELFTLLTCGTATMSSALMILVGVMVGNVLPDLINHIIASAILSIPASLLTSRIIVPEEKEISFSEDKIINTSGSILEACYKGIVEGAKVYISIIIMIIGFIAIIDILNKFIGLINFTSVDISIQKILGIIFYPISWLMDIDKKDMNIFAMVLGNKITFNEIIAYKELSKHALELSVRSKTLLVYSISNFANFGSLGVITAVYCSLLPERKQTIFKLAFRAIVAGTIACLINAIIVGLII